jgi:CCGSCS motif protein
MMEKQTNKDLSATQNTESKVEAAVAEQAEKKETVTATQFDPKEAKHGVDFCCGSCGG